MEGLGIHRSYIFDWGLWLQVLSVASEGEGV